MSDTSALVVEPAIGMSALDWLAVSQRPSLDDRVPQDVRNYFAVARGVLAYGAFSLPCLHFGGDQILRAAECAVRHHSTAAGVKAPKASFADRLEFLKDRGLLTEDEVVRWSNTRKLRNSVAHRVRTTHEAPVSYLERSVEVADLIVALFRSCPPASTEPSEYRRTSDNWLIPDRNFAWLAGVNWRERLQVPTLAAGVPSEVRHLFEQTRAAMAFGQYFYVLCSLVGEVSHHIGVVALEQRCAALMGRRAARKASAPEHISVLVRAGILNLERAKALEPLIQLRDWASHPDMQTIVPPTYHFRGVELLCDDLNYLFR